MQLNTIVELVPVESLIPYARNARTHSDAQIAQIAASIREFGFTNPILIDGEGGIIAGHGRLLAARKLALPEVPCIRLGYLSKTQRQALVLADNQLALNAGWDAELLRVELEDLELGGFDLDLIGFGATSNEVEPLEDMPDLPDGDREPFQQMTFTLHDEQAEQVQQAIEAAKGMGPFTESPNENSNGNALARICETFLGKYGNR